MNSPKRYSPWLVTLHWLVVALVFSEFFIAMMVLARMPATDVRIVPLGVHMAIGITILLLMVLRIFVRARTAHPAPASIGNAFLDKVGVITHFLLYVFTILMALSGMLLAASNNLLQIVFGGTGGLPEHISPMLHGLIFPLLALLIVMHIGAAVLHQFIKKDNLLARMWYGKD